jgi:hypothetical protein
MGGQIATKKILSFKSARYVLEEENQINMLGLGNLR